MEFTQFSDPFYSIVIIDLPFDVVWYFHYLDSSVLMSLLAQRLHDPNQGRVAPGLLLRRIVKTGSALCLLPVSWIRKIWTEVASSRLLHVADSWREARCEGLVFLVLVGSLPQEWERL